MAFSPSWMLRAWRFSSPCWLFTPRQKHKARGQESIAAFSLSSVCLSFHNLGVHFPINKKILPLCLVGLELWSPSSYRQEPQLTGQLKPHNHQRQGQEFLHSSSLLGSQETQFRGLKWSQVPHSSSFFWVYLSSPSGSQRESQVSYPANQRKLNLALSVQTCWFQTKWVWGERVLPSCGGRIILLIEWLWKMKCVRADTEEITKLVYSLPLLHSSSSLE